MVASDNFSEADIVDNSIESIRKSFGMFADTKIDMSRVENGATGFSTAGEHSGISLAASSCDPGASNGDGGNKQDTYSVGSFSSTSSSSSSLSSMGITFESERKISSASTVSVDQQGLKLFGPANSSQSGDPRLNPPTLAHPRIRRVPSTANPKYRVPKLQRTHRSKSQPHMQPGQLLNQRRTSAPSHFAGGTQLPVHGLNMKQTFSSPDFTYNPPQEKQQPAANQQPPPQQQIIYLQIPQPSQSQLCDPQSLQLQISSQLQLLVPQIYNQLLSQITVDSCQLNAGKNAKPQDSAQDPSSPSKDLNQSSYLSSNFTQEAGQSQRVMNQVLQQNTDGGKPCAEGGPSHQRKRHKSSHTHRQQTNVQKAPPAENPDEVYSQPLPITDLTQILQHIPMHLLQQNHAQTETSYIEIERVPGYPKITIPLTQELILQCQQLQHRESGFAPYQPRLETILEESLSVKHLKTSRFSKTKIVACVVTVLCVIVVILLAGDKTVAVAVVAAIFILFLLGSTFYLYTQSTKNDLETHGDAPRLQVSTISSCDKAMV